MLLATLLLGALAGAPALAQDAPPPAGDVLVAGDSVLSIGQQAWLLEATPSQRFPEGEVEGPEFEADERITVLYIEPERVRVRRGSRYGWVPADALTAEAPEGAAPAPTTGGAQAPSGEFSMEELQELLERTGGGK